VSDERARRLQSVPDRVQSHSDLVEKTYLEHSARLWRSVRAFSGDPDVASDAVAEAFAQLLRRGDGVRDPGAWVWRTAFRIASGDLKTRRTYVEASLADEPTARAEPEVIDLLRALSQLSHKQRLAVVLHDYAGFPARDGAELAGSTEAAMRVHLMRGRRRLRALLDD
jgi:RNA polymerase sigma-70 factor (ECF subfamily)